MSSRSLARIPMVTGQEGLAVVASPWHPCGPHFNQAWVWHTAALGSHWTVLRQAGSLPGSQKVQSRVGGKRPWASLRGRPKGPLGLSAQRPWEPACLYHRRIQHRPT